MTVFRNRLKVLAAQEFFEAEGVEQLPWPARSPDLNPIEHAWDALGQAINDKDNLPQTRQELAQALTDEWDALPIDIINNLVDSMPQCLNALRERP
uniref:Tc1-like transposase DDE domain-containing protein n=1 Tax=Eptatretus burgeri TaxID=7764 RepID=A0A8C4R350_EPTBU